MALPTPSPLKPDEQKTLDELIKRLDVAKAEGKNQLFIPDSDPIVAKAKSPAMRFRGLQPLGIISSFPSSGGIMLVYKSELVGKVEEKKSAPFVPPPVHVPNPKVYSNLAYHEPDFLPDIMSVVEDKASVIVWLVGPSQCLSGDTVISTSRGGNGRQFTLKYLYNATNGNPDGLNMKGFDPNVVTKVRSFDGKEIHLNQALKFIYSGKKEVFNLSLNDGKSLKLTADHQVMTKRGYVKLQDMTMDDLVMVDSLNAVNSGKAPKRDGKRGAVNNLWFHPYATKVKTNKESRGYTLKVRSYQAIYDAAQNGISLEEFVQIVKTDAKKAKSLKYVNPKITQIHHKNGDCSDDRIENLEAISKSEHSKEHGLHANFNQGIPSYVGIKEIVKVGIEDVYDISCNAPYHNFVANGIVVHNCGKSMLVKHLGEKLCRKVYKIPCRGDMDSTPFCGQRTVKMDKDGNKVVMDVAGIVELAMKEGLDDQGNPIGEPAILFIDEAPSCPAHIMIGLNSFFESDDPVRKLHLEDGRTIKSHPGLRIILAGNTNGRGAQTMQQAMYAAQTNQLDMSLLNRVGVFFTMGYSRKVEKKILDDLIDDPPVVKKIEDFRNAYRQACVEEKASSPLSTKRLIDIANSYRVFKDLGKAFHYSLMSYLTPEERVMSIDLLKLKTGIELHGRYTSPDTDYV